MRNPFRIIWERMTARVWAEAFSIGYELALRTSAPAGDAKTKQSQINDLAKHAAEGRRA